MYFKGFPLFSRAPIGSFFFACSFSKYRAFADFSGRGSPFALFRRFVSFLPWLYPVFKVLCAPNKIRCFGTTLLVGYHKNIFFVNKTLKIFLKYFKNRFEQRRLLREYLSLGYSGKDFIVKQPGNGKMVCLVFKNSVC
jgi:hypothetical protein